MDCLTGPAGYNAPMTAALGRASACGKLILCGEHFVVHGAPALALPLTVVSTEVTVHAAPGAAGPLLDSDAPDALLDLAQQMVQRALDGLGLAPQTPWRIEVRSSVPLGAGLGSSAAFSVALVGALAEAALQRLDLEGLNARAHALEGLVHGSPSGIDNTVISHRRPLWFVKGAESELLDGPGTLGLVLASSGAPRSTREAVAAVGALRQAEPARFAELCDRARDVTTSARTAFASGDAKTLGGLMNENHELLRAIGVSTPTLDRLTEAARGAGALGAKLTGGGRGGFIVALLPVGGEGDVSAALKQAGATQLLRVMV
jgi:mevalonate kinase